MPEPSDSIGGETVDPLKLISLLLQYPDQELWAARGALREEVEALSSRARRQSLLRFLAVLESGSLAEAQRRYVEDLDFSRRSTLHLTYHRWGDLRQRGLALLRLKQRYAAAGLELDDAELPDYLPVMLEFCALAPEQGAEVMNEHREAIELVRSSLHEQGSPYAELLEAIVAGLPKLTRRQAARAARLAAKGPPSEDVGLEPFAPPEVMPMPAAEAIPSEARR